MDKFELLKLSLHVSIRMFEFHFICDIVEVSSIVVLLREVLCAELVTEKDVVELVDVV